jgi:hypothetical protein
MALTRKQLDVARCSCCGAPSQENPLDCVAVCHPDAGLVASYWDGVLVLSCAQCKKFVGDFQIASGIS